MQWVSHAGWVKRNREPWGGCGEAMKMILDSHCWMVITIVVFVIHRFFNWCIFLSSFFQKKWSFVALLCSYVWVVTCGLYITTLCISPKSHRVRRVNVYGLKEIWSSLPLSFLHHAGFLFHPGLYFSFYYKNLRSLIFSSGAKPKKKRNAEEWVETVDGESLKMTVFRCSFQKP